MGIHCKKQADEFVRKIAFTQLMVPETVCGNERKDKGRQRLFSNKIVCWVNQNFCCGITIREVLSQALNYPRITLGKRPFDSERTQNTFVQKIFLERIMDLFLRMFLNKSPKTEILLTNKV